MSTDEATFVERLKGIESGDAEGSHSRGDDLLVEALRHLGWNALADEWERQSSDWWWA